MNRKPPLDVQKELRKEVKFGCPVEGCGCPYLTWHHFDPPWNEKNYHNPAGVIALCHIHHDQADAGAFTKEQLRALKKNPHGNEVEGRFNWMRNSLLLAAGSGFYLNPIELLRVKGKTIISFTRDENNNLLLNINLTDKNGTVKFEMIENVWSFSESPSDLESPPSGKKLKIEYPNKDKFRLNFWK